MPERPPVKGRWMLQLGLLGATLVAGIAAWIARTGIIELLNASSEVEVRNTLLQETW